MELKKKLNIMNFVRADDPRRDPELVFDTYVKQLDMCDSYQLPYTMMFQYDAFVKERYGKALEERPNPLREIGLWLEMCRELILKVGLEWNSDPDCPWDWHVNPDMLMAYTTKERELLIDEIMAEFKKTFGYYPTSVGSWLLDNYSVNYMKEKYDIRAVLICKEQYGTDGYTLWGGYYNQGYYPSKKNILSPAQTLEEQVKVPVFRILGIDPIYQYEAGLDENYNSVKWQNVLTLEPACKIAQNPDWVDWFFRTNYETEELAFSYVQAGQENVFLWPEVVDGFNVQMPRIAKLAKEGKISVETVTETGNWYIDRFPMTPATAITALEDWQDKGKQSVWYNCKNYRINWYRNGENLCIRDNFFFHEQYAERYEQNPAKGTWALYDTLPVVDGYRWGGEGIHAAMYFTEVDSEKMPAGKILSSVQYAEDESVLALTFELDGEPVTCDCCEDGVRITFSKKPFALDFNYRSLEDTQILEISDHQVTYEHNGFTYALTTTGTVVPKDKGYRILPEGNQIELKYMAL